MSVATDSTGSFLADPKLFEKDELACAECHTHVALEAIRDPVLREALSTFDEALGYNLARAVEIGSYAFRIAILPENDTLHSEEFVDLLQEAFKRIIGRPNINASRLLQFVVAGEAIHWQSRLVIDELLLDSVGEQELRSETGVLDPPPAVEAVGEIANWLGVSVGDVLKAAGISKRTFQSWKALDVHRPRQSSEGRLWLLHQLAQDLVEVKGRSGLRQWLEADPSRRRLLRAGKVDELAERAYRTTGSQHVPWLGAGNPEQRYVDQPGGGLALEMDPGDVVEPES